MPFRVSARTVLQLGAELISSDGIAFYELVKNAIDAGSPSVSISVVSRVPYNVYELAIRALAGDNDALAELSGPAAGRHGARKGAQSTHSDIASTVRDAVEAALVADAPGLDALRSELAGAMTVSELEMVLAEANYIEVADTGEGMSLADLGRVYLTIGTTNRLHQRAANPGDTGGRTRPILGEKGIGRLSVMRLGDVLRVRTAREEGASWNLLEVDWREFAREGERDIGDVRVSPRVGPPRRAGEPHGTTIHVAALNSAWSLDRLQQLAVANLARLSDPFAPTRFPILLAFNGVGVDIPRLADFIFSHAHGYLTARYDPDAHGGPALTGRVEYRLRGRSRAIDLRGAHLASAAGGVTQSTLRRVGPFELEVYWFNRRILTKIEGIGTLADVRRLIQQWGGGVALYRDGFRVHPYADPGNDWLRLDREAFSTSGFKLNTGQVIGRALISRDRNPYLVDQTNREGLRESPEKAAFVELLVAVMDNEFRGFLNQVDAHLKTSDRLTLTDVTTRVADEEDRIQRALDELLRELPDSQDAKAFAADVSDAVASIRDLNDQVRRTAATYETGRSQLVHLASVGLMVEILAHELWRATDGALRTIADARVRGNAAGVGSTLSVLDAQLKTLQKRLKVLDPLSTSARQTKETFELVDWIRTILTDYAPQLERRKIARNMSTMPKGCTLRVHAVRGMIVQVIENLLSNAAYWLAQERQYRGPFEPRVDIVVDCDRKQVRITDNGPGVPREQAERIFEPYYTTKPPKQGKGLGLFISREIAEYHGGRLYMADEPDEHGTLHTFVFELGSAVA